MHSRLLLTFSFVKIIVVRFILRSLLHLGLSFVHGDIYGSFCILLHVDIQLCQHHLLKMLSIFHCIVLDSLSEMLCKQSRLAITKQKVHALKGSNYNPTVQIVMANLWLLYQSRSFIFLLSLQYNRIGNVSIPSNELYLQSGLIVVF